jgi:hypothetical protein
MRLMGWDVDIVHRCNDYLVDADYWSRLDANLCYDPSFRQYLHIVSDLRRTHPPPVELPMKPVHMPYYRGPRIPVKHCPSGTSTDDNTEDVDANALMTTSLLSAIMAPPALASTHLMLAHSTPFLPLKCVVITTPNFQLWHTERQCFLGQSMASTLDISSQQLRNKIFHFASFWHATLLNMAAVCSVNSPSGG